MILIFKIVEQSYQGLMGINWERGSNMTLGARKETIEPTKNDDFITATGNTGRVGSTSAGVLTVKLIPVNIRIIDRIIVTHGPLNTESNKLDLFAGNNLKGVIVLKVPICN